jgi:hypothetical protein
LKITKILSLSSIFLFVGCASHAAQNLTTEEKLYGKWNCEFSEARGGQSFSIVTEDTYIRNGRSNSFGDLKFTVPKMPGEEFVYSVTATADWYVQGKYLVMTMDDVKIVNLSHPGLDDVFSLAELFPENVSESAEIVDLSATKLVLRSESDNSITECIR